MLLWKGGTLMFFKGSPSALKETNRSPDAACMKGNNNHASTFAIFILVRSSAHPDPCDTAANKKRKIPPRLSRDPTPDGAPLPNGRRPSSLPAAATLLPRRRRWRSFLASDGGAPPSPVALPLTAASHLQRSFASSASVRPDARVRRALAASRGG